MVPRRHLFVAVTPMAFGEVLQGRRVAEALVRAGEHVSFIAPAAVQGALAGAPFRRGVIESLGSGLLDSLVPQVAEDERVDSVCLVDLAAVALTFANHRLDFAALARPRYRLVALDLWSLAETDRVFDFGAHRQPLPATILEVPRLVPVPFARPEIAGGYNAWPSQRALDSATRAAVRVRFGLADSTRVVVLATAVWQTPESQIEPHARAAAVALPPLIVDAVARAGATLVHIGPRAWAAASERYRFVPQLPPSEFDALIGAADCVLTANLSATTIATALAAEVPVVVIGSAGDAVAPFAVWPLGLRSLLAPVFADNPLLACLRRIDLLDEDAVETALAPDAGWGERLRDYRARVTALPGAAEGYAGLLG